MAKGHRPEGPILWLKATGPKGASVAEGHKLIEPLLWLKATGPKDPYCGQRPQAPIIPNVTRLTLVS